MRKILFTVAGAALLVIPAIALAAPIAGPSSIARVSGEIITVNHLSEAHRGKHIRTRHVRAYPGPRWTPGIDGYALTQPAASGPVPDLLLPVIPVTPT